MADVEELEDHKHMEMRKHERTIVFIKAVRKEEALWNTYHDLYGSLKVKDRLWEKLAKDHSFKNGQEAKVEWKRLRDIYRDSLKRRRFKPLKPWKFSAYMSFLRPMMTNRKPHNDLTLGMNDPTQNIIDENSEERFDEAELETEPPMMALCKGEPEEMDAEMDQASYDTNLRNSLSDLNESRDALHHFFASMHDSTKMLPKLYQMQVKRKVFDAVMMAEEEFLRTQMSQSEFIDVTIKADNFQ